MKKINAALFAGLCLTMFFFQTLSASASLDPLTILPPPTQNEVVENVQPLATGPVATQKQKELIAALCKKYQWDVSDVSFAQTTQRVLVTNQLFNDYITASKKVRLSGTSEFVLMGSKSYWIDGIMQPYGITFYMFFDSAGSKIVGAFLELTIFTHTPLPYQLKIYPLNLSKASIDKQVAVHYRKSFAQPFDSLAKQDFPLGYLASNSVQKQLTDLFNEKGWTKPKYLFYQNYSHFTVLDDSFDILPYFSAEERIKIAQFNPKMDASRLPESGFYFSEHVFSLTGTQYRFYIDFCAAYAKPDPLIDTTELFTWLVVKPSETVQGTRLPRFFYPANTPASTIAQDMGQYFLSKLQPK